MPNDLVVPPLGESITEAIIGQWLKKVGETIEADEPVVDLETDKVTVQLPSPVAGVLTEQRFAEGDTVKVGDVVGQVDEAAAAGAQQEAAKPTPARAEHEAADGEGRVTDPPAAKPAPQPAPQDDIDEAALRRMSPAQRRSVRLGEHAPAPAATPAATAEAARPAAPARKAAPAPTLAPTRTADEDVVPMSPLRRRIAERLVQAQRESASLTTFNEVDMSAIMSLRRQHGEAFLDTYGVKLGFLSFFAKASVAACRRFPGVNAEVRGDSIVYKKHYDFGIAVSTERGLVVPVLRGIDQLGFAEIEQGIGDLATKVRKNKITLDELTGGTFTITNGGIFGSMLSTPLLNYPQTGILGMHNIVKRPVAVGDEVEVRPVMYIALTYDHRVVDGREAVQFLVAVKDRLEHPERLLFDV